MTLKRQATIAVSGFRTQNLRQNAHPLQLSAKPQRPAFPTPPSSDHTCCPGRQAQATQCSGPSSATLAFQVTLSNSNVEALRELAAKPGWEVTSALEKIKIHTLEEQEGVSVWVEKSVRCPAHLTYRLLSDFTKRPLWDPHYVSCTLIDQVSEDDQICHITCPRVNGDKPRDLVVLVSRRRPPRDGGTYVVAARSVVLPAMPPAPGYTRSEVACAGFLIQPTDGGSCTVSYLNQMSASILPYFAGNLGGWSKSIEETAASCIRFIENASNDAVF